MNAAKTVSEPSAIDDLILREMARLDASDADLQRAARFLRSERSESPKAYQELPRRPRRLVDLLIAA